MVFPGMAQDDPGGSLETTNVMTRIRKQTLQIAEHFRHFDDFLDSDTLLEACSLLAPSESGLFLVVSRNKKIH